VDRYRPCLFGVGFALFFGLSPATAESPDATVAAHQAQQAIGPTATMTPGAAPTMPAVPTAMGGGPMVEVDEYSPASEGLEDLEECVDGSIAPRC
jgi:hypothetical protein